MKQKKIFAILTFAMIALSACSNSSNPITNAQVKASPTPWPTPFTYSSPTPEQQNEKLTEADLAVKKLIETRPQYKALVYTTSGDDNNKIVVQMVPRDPTVLIVTAKRIHNEYPESKFTLTYKKNKDMFLDLQHLLRGSLTVRENRKERTDTFLRRAVLYPVGGEDAVEMIMPYVNEAGHEKLFDQLLAFVAEETGIELPLAKTELPQDEVKKPKKDENSDSKNENEIVKKPANEPVASKQVDCSDLDLSGNWVWDNGEKGEMLRTTSNLRALGSKEKDGIHFTGEQVRTDSGVKLNVTKTAMTYLFHPESCILVQKSEKDRVAFKVTKINGNRDLVEYSVCTDEACKDYQKDAQGSIVKFEEQKKEIVLN